ncbi:hypothetical protein LTR17_016629 [Elasticomyces elasticus]|nr:hypothetical protein LTR17_016629 [Elasticomyces elasticus]
MKPHSVIVAAHALLSLASPSATHRDQPKYDVRPFRIDLDHGVPRMLDLVCEARLPERPEYPSLGDSAGIDLDVLEGLREEWLNSFDWPKEQASMNDFKHFTVQIEGLKIHFIHEKAADPMPSLPGFAFSSPPPANWTIDDTARVYNTLMTGVLGYKTFAVFGTDWGAGPSYSLYNNFNATTRAAHFAFVPYLPKTVDALKVDDNITLTSAEAFEEAESEAWLTTRQGYFGEQTTDPNTLGLALYDNPVGQLAWIGDKYINYSDPRAGTGVSLVTHNEILREVSLYYLTRSFLSSVFIYSQNKADGFKQNYVKANTDAPMLFSAFKYNIAFWPPQLVSKVGNLVFYHNHDFGGHFPGIDNPPALLADLREIGNYWLE